MAGIDKMYWTYEETLKFYEWFFQHYKVNKQGVDMMESINSDHKYIDNIFSVTNFSTKTDKYLMKHCKLPFIQKRLSEQY